MSLPFIPFWKAAPFTRLLPPLISGILLQFYYDIPLAASISVAFACYILIIIFFFLPVSLRYRYSVLNGLVTFSFFIAASMLITRQNNMQHTVNSLFNCYKERDILHITLDEKPVKKIKTYKANASVDYLIRDQHLISINATVVIYFKSVSDLSAGSTLLVQGRLQTIRGSGNPASFDYGLYAFMQGISHQLYLLPENQIILTDHKQSRLSKLLDSIREKILRVLRKYISSEKNAGLAEALLIGYKNDLDKTLVSSYSNTGVVHIIAISGLHVGLIYCLLRQLFGLFHKLRLMSRLSPLFILAGLWLFTLLAGAQPSVLRSAIMFSCIAVGQAMARKSSIYNSLAMSAFLLLCYNPYWLWDVGFQLSFAAVLSILLFGRPVYNCLYFPNKLIDMAWQLSAVTISAQLLTTPLCIFHFHQFPTYFLLSNFIAVPLSSLILLSEIFLCGISFIPSLAILTGRITNWMIELMNSSVERLEKMPFALWEGLQITVLQAVLMTAFILSICYWLQEKSKTAFRLGCLMLILCLSVHSYSLIQAQHQKRIIVYNLQSGRIIEFLDGREFYSFGDSSVNNDYSRNLYLKPSHTLYRVRQATSLSSLHSSGNYFTFYSTHILLINDSRQWQSSAKGSVIDLLIISGKQKIEIGRLSNSFLIRQIVTDGTVPPWHALSYKRQADSLGIALHDVAVKGAFVMNLR